VKKTILLFLVSFFYLLCFSQNSARVSMIKGTRIVFNFETFKDIKEGKTLGTPPSGFTEIKVYYKHSEIQGWILSVRSNESALNPSYGSTSLPLDIIEMRTYLDGVPYNTVLLSDVDQVICRATGDYTMGGTHVITIVYDCAKNGELMGMETDVFTTDLVITLQSQ